MDYKKEYKLLKKQYLKLGGDRDTINAISESNLDSKVKKTLKRQIYDIDNETEFEKKIKLLHELFQFVSENLKLLQSNPALGVITKKILEQLYRDENVNKTDLEWISKLYKKIFDIDIDKSESDKDLLDNFKSIQVCGISDNFKIKVAGKTRLNLELINNEEQIEARANINLLRRNKLDWMDETLYLAIINNFTIEHEFRDKGNCKKIFKHIINYLLEIGINAIQLYVSSDTPIKACKCYIGAAENSGLYFMDLDMKDKCSNNTILIFTKYKVPSKYKQLYKDFSKLNDPLLKSSLKNYDVSLYNDYYDNY